MAQRKSWASYVIWGSFAVCAVLAAAFTIAVVVGAHRGMQFAGISKKTVAPPPLDRPQMTVTTPAPPAGERERSRVNDALRDLAAERDRLVARIEQLERAVGDITASIQERSEPTPQVAPPGPSGRVAQEPAAQTTEPARSQERVTTAAPSPPSAAAPTGSVNPGVRASAPLSDPMDIFRPYVGMRQPVAAPTPAQAPMQIQASPKSSEAAQPPTATRTEFAVDLGSEPSIEALRSRWTSLRASHGPSLDGLRPLVSIREGAKPGSMELRLIAGPLGNAGAAARTCAALQAKGVNCQTAVFDGQRLALR
jgi:hypothetical protein